MKLTENNGGCCCHLDEDFCHEQYAKLGIPHPSGPPPKRSLVDKIVDFLRKLP